MNGKQPQSTSTDPKPQSQGWQRHFTRQRLRIFIVLSVAAHLILGLSWGVPAYIKEQRRRAEEARLQAEEEAKRAAADAELAKNKAKDLAATIDDVQEQTKKSFDNLAGDLNHTDQEKTWEAVKPSVLPAEKRLAEALGDRTTSEQDLRNLQANLDRDLVKAVNDTLSVDIGKEETEAFLAAVESKVAPLLLAHYKSQMSPKVAAPVRAKGDEFVRVTKDATGAAMTQSADLRRAIGDALRKQADSVDTAAGAVDQSVALAAKNPAAPAEELKKSADNAATALASAATAADSVKDGLAKFADIAKPLNGTADLSDRVAATRDALAAAVESLKKATATEAAGKHAEASAQLAGLALSQKKLTTLWLSAAEAADRAIVTAEQAARGALNAVKEKSVPQKVDSQLASSFREKAQPRLTGVLTGALKTRLEAVGVKLDDAQVTAAMDRAKKILETNVADVGGYGASTSQTLRDAANSARPVEGGEGEKLASTFFASAEPVIVAGVNDVVSDASLDARIVDLLSKPDKDPGRDEVHDRVAMLAARAADGRAMSLDTVNFTDLRAQAMARSDSTNRAAENANDPNATAPTTMPADALPVIEDIKKEILAGLSAELKKMFEGKLAEEKAKKVEDHAAAKVDDDINHLAQDLIDPKVSDSDLETRRLEFSKKYLNAVAGGLDKTATDDVKKALLDSLNGKAGDAVAKSFKDAVKENVGGALSREWKAAADADKSDSSQQVRDIRDALTTTKAVAEKAGQLLDQAKQQTAAASPSKKTADPDAVKAAIDSARGKLKEINNAIASAKSDMTKAQKDVPADAAELKARLGEIGEAFDKVAQSVADADKAGEGADKATFTKAVTEARKQVDQFKSTLTKGDASLVKEGAQAEAKFIKAADQAKEDVAAADGKNATPGVKSRIEEKFDGEFRKEALPQLTQNIAKGVQQKLEAAGVSVDDGDQKALEKEIAAALDKKVTGDQAMGKAALENLEAHKFFDAAKKVEGEPTKEQVTRANEIADKVTDKGVKAAVGGTAGDNGAKQAVETAGKPDAAVIEAKDKVARVQGQLRGNRGGVLDAPAEGAVADASDKGEGVAAMRKKWKGLLAGLQGDTAAAAGGATAKGNGSGSPSGNGSASASASGPGVGPGGGRLGGGQGPGNIEDWGPGGRYWAQIDEAKRKALVEALKERAAQQGAAWDRQGAMGLVDRTAREKGAVSPASVVVPATRPSQTAKNDQPYTPTFKSLQFAVVPYINKPIPIGENFDAWNDIPAIHLRPELTWIAGKTDGLKIADDVQAKVAWDNTGLYFMVDVTDPNGKLDKSTINTFWDCDCVELFLDTMNTKELKRGTGAGQQFWCWPFGSSEDANAPGGESLYSRTTGFKFVALKPGEMSRFARKTPNGYQVQWWLPTEHVRDADLVPGKILGMNLTVETGVKMHYYWSASKVVGTPYHPDTWGDILLAGSDGKVEFPEKLAAEGSAAEKMATGFVVGEPLRIRVTDRDMNLNDKVKDKISVTVQNGRKEREVAILEETTASSGVFEGSVQTALALDERVPGKVGAFEGEAVSVVYVDQARANGARNTEIVSRIKAGATVTVGR